MDFFGSCVIIPWRTLAPQESGQNNPEADCFLGLLPSPLRKREPLQTYKIWGRCLLITMVSLSGLDAMLCQVGVS